MDSVMPISSLRNFEDVFAKLKPGDQIKFVKSGVAVGTLVNTQDWERAQAEIRLLTVLNTADQSFDTGTSLSDFRARHKQ